MPGIIHQSKKQVAQLFAARFIVGCFLKLSKFFVDLEPSAVG